MMMEKKRPAPPKQRQQQLQQRLAPPGRREPQAMIQASAAKRTPPSDNNASFWAVVAVALLCLAGLLWYNVWLLLLPHADDLIVVIAKCQVLAEGARNDAEITDDIALALHWCAKYGGYRSVSEFVQYF